MASPQMDYSPMGGYGGMYNQNYGGQGYQKNQEYNGGVKKQYWVFPYYMKVLPRPR